MTYLAILVGAFAVAASCQPAVGAQKVTKAEQLNWIRYTVPLPKQIRIAGKVEVKVGSVAIVKPQQQHLLIDQAAKELGELVGECSGQPAFTVRMVLGGADAQPLRSLKNSDQACRVHTVGESELVVAALDPRGLYYGVKTLQQLVRARKAGDQIEMPLVEMTDWPDMAERGLWGTDNFNHLKWLGDRKMNLMEQISWQGVDADGKPFARPQEGRMVMFTDGPLYAINPVPVSLHLEQIAHRFGVFAAYPFLKGKCEHPGVMCYSQPKTVEIMTDWFVDLMNLPNVTGIDQWMTENLQNKPGCQCDLCVKTGVDPMVLEARAIIMAWRAAEERLARKIDLRILTSEATEDFNRQILAELPKGVKVVYYHSLLTYQCGRFPMLRQYLADWVKGGGYLLVCPNISSFPGFVQPLTSAEFIKGRMTEFVDKGLSGLLGYSTPRVHYYKFNVEASAEWTWNSKGRSTREFALSYAMRQGLKDPGKFADYSDAIGPVLWDVYGSDWPQRAENWILDPIDKRLKDGTVPDLGYVHWGFMTVPFGSIKTLRQLDNDVRAADKAVKLAQEIGIDEYIHESRYAQGLIRSLKALYELRGLVKDGRIRPEHRSRAKRWFQVYVDGLRQAADAVGKWEDTVRTSTEKQRMSDKVAKIIHAELIDRMIPVAREMGIEVR